MKLEKLTTKNFEAIGRLLNYLFIAIYYKKVTLTKKHIDTQFQLELKQYLHIIRHRKEFNISEEHLLILGTYLIHCVYNVYGNQMCFIFRGKNWYINCETYLTLNYDLNSELLLEVIENYQLITSSNISKCF